MVEVLLWSSPTVVFWADSLWSRIRIFLSSFTLKERRTVGLESCMYGHTNQESKSTVVKDDGFRFGTHSGP